LFNVKGFWISYNLTFRYTALLFRAYVDGAHPSAFYGGLTYEYRAMSFLRIAHSFGKGDVNPLTIDKQGGLKNEDAF
tara:strand:- start:608 stop:838 length:231 start_codon:yes stop_codon:yes gene_type:complete